MKNLQNLSNRRKLEGILLEIAQVMQDCGTRFEAGFQAHHYEAQIGDITAKVSCHLTGHPSRYTDKACVELTADGRNLAKIYTYRGYVLGTHQTGVIGISDATKIALVSPHWKKDNGVVTKTQVAPERGRSPLATQSLHVYHANYETADWVINELCKVMQSNLAQKSDKKRKLVVDFEGGRERVFSNRYKMEKVLLALEKGMPQLSFDAAPDTKQATADFKGALRNGVTFDGTCRADLEAKAFKNVSISLHNKRHELGMITTDGGFTERLRGHYHHSRILNEVRGVRPTTKIAVISPLWSEADGRMTITNSNVQNDDNEKAISQLTVYHAANESADAVVNAIYGAVTREKMTLTEKLHNLVQPKNSGREM